MRLTSAAISAALLAVSVLSGCDGSQSALSGFGVESARIVTLSSIMFIGAALILALVCLMVAIALFGAPAWRRRVASSRLVIWLGIVLPVVTLSLLLFYGFYILRLGLPTPPSSDTIKITVTGHQWWWRVVYHHPDGTTTETANELRIPVGHEVALALRSSDVIHSFWVPAYAGKVDMMPGRTNRLNITATEAGRVRGQCAEYCGGAHAFMVFYVEALPPADFERWMDSERGQAVPNALSEAFAPGRELFLASGCGGCHTVRGTAARGTIGPDLTHIGNRYSIGAGTLRNTRDNVQTWLEQHQAIKPGNKMPSFDFLNDKERRHIAQFLMALE